MNRFCTWVFLISTALPAWGNDMYRFYPVGTVSQDAIYQALDHERVALRQCHKTYLDQIPGGFDTLQVEFQINPKGRANFFSIPSASTPKDIALACLKSVIGSLNFAKPKYGVVFVRYDSDLNAHQYINTSDLALSRNSVMLVPYLPQKMIEAQIEMFMPYYQPCFDAVAKATRPALIELIWDISDTGLPEDIVVQGNGLSSSVRTCVQEVTKQHRYPSGFVRTKAKRSFRVR